MKFIVLQLTVLINLKRFYGTNLFIYEHNSYNQSYQYILQTTDE